MTMLTPWDSCSPSNVLGKRTRHLLAGESNQLKSRKHPPVGCCKEAAEFQGTRGAP